MFYKTVLADPPWPYNDKNGPRVSPALRPKTWNGVSGCVGSAARYGNMPIQDLKELPVPDFCDQNSHLYLWYTNSFCVEAHEVARAWGFVPKTSITWGKTKSDGTASMKAGHYFRGATEHCLFAVRGKLKLLGPPCPTLFLHPRIGEHSKKPDKFYDLIEEQSPPDYLELFCRKKRLGWHGWGNQIVSDVELAPNPKR